MSDMIVISNLATADIRLDDEASSMHALGVSVRIRNLKFEFEVGNLSLDASDFYHMTDGQFNLIAEAMVNGKAKINTMTVVGCGNSNMLVETTMRRVAIKSIKRTDNRTIDLCLVFEAHGIPFQAQVSIKESYATFLVAVEGESLDNLDLRGPLAHEVPDFLITPMELLSNYIKAARAQQDLSNTIGRIIGAL